MDYLKNSASRRCFPLSFCHKLQKKSSILYKLLKTLMNDFAFATNFGILDIYLDAEKC